MTAARKTEKVLLAFGIIAGFGASPLAHAYANHDDYLNALKIADKYVQRQRALEQSAGALSSELVKSLYGRYYQVGDTWEVAVAQSPMVMMRKTADPTQLKPGKAKITYFKYSVTALKSGVNPEVTIEVTQLEDPNSKIVDPQVEKLIITMSDQFTQDKKAYLFKGAPQPVEVSAEGVRSSATPLELYPLDVPNVRTADRQEVKEIPSIPEELQSIATQTGYRLEAANSSWFEQDDFFGRPVKFLWQQGEPWPSYLQTPHGTAILIRRRSR